MISMIKTGKKGLTDASQEICCSNLWDTLNIFKTLEVFHLLDTIFSSDQTRIKLRSLVSKLVLIATSYDLLQLYIGFWARKSCGPAFFADWQNRIQIPCYVYQPEIPILGLFRHNDKHVVRVEVLFSPNWQPWQILGLNRVVCASDKPVVTICGESK